MSTPTVTPVPASHAIEQGACRLSMSDGNATPTYLEIPWKTLDPAPSDTVIDVGTSANRSDGVNFKASLVTMRDTPLNVKTFRLVTEDASPTLLPVAAALAALAAVTGYAGIENFMLEFPEGGGYTQDFSIKDLKPFGGDYTGASGFEFTLVPYGGPTALT